MDGQVLCVFSPVLADVRAPGRAFIELLLMKYPLEDSFCEASV